MGRARFLTQVARAGLGLCVVWALTTLAARALIVREPLPEADVLLVMAGAPVYAERLLHAAELFRSGRYARILLTNDGQRGRWSRALQRNPPSVERAATALEGAGVPRERIEVLPGIVHGTIDEARAAERYTETHMVRTLVVVTSPYHSRRAVWTLRRVLGTRGVAVGSEPVPATATTPGVATWWRSSAGWRMVPSEFVKLPYYWIAYGLGAARTN